MVGVRRKANPAIEGDAVTRRVMLLGMDGCSPDLLLRWSEDGSLPVLRGLRERGLSCRLDSPPGCGDDGAWATAYTGVSPATHGRFYYRRMRPGTYSLPAFGDDDLRHEPLWTVLGRAGKRVAVVDVPKSPLPRDINGVFLGDWLVHGRDHHAPVACPLGFAAEAVERFGAAPESLCHFTQPPLDAGGYGAMLDRLGVSTRMKRDLCLSLLEREAWDLFFAVFKECHCAGHHGWHLHDREHPEYDAGIATVTGDPLLRAYREVDAALGALITRAGPDTAVLVFSVLGMGPNYGMAWALPAILERLDPARRVATPARRVLKPVGSWLYRVLKGPARKLVNRASGSIGASYRTGQRAFSIEPSENVSGIRLNLAGREPRGMIRPGAEAAACCRQLAADLLEVTDPDTGERLIGDVVPVGEIYDGPLLDHLPDLLVFWNLSRPVEAVASPKIGVIQASGPRRRSGSHMPGGVLFAAGAGIAPLAGIAPSRPLVDLAATVGALLGVPLGEGAPAVAGSIPH
jgi:predicted AlkP superfamily phosphohydrolase/phosphomutase